MVGIVTTLEGPPLDKGDIASRLGGFDDIGALEKPTPATTDAELHRHAARSKNDLHNNYQDFQAFLDAGGRIGLQHDPLLYGAYLLNPFLVRVELVPMLVVNQGEVAVIKGFVGLPTLDTSGAEFKFGSIVRPGHRGIWQEPLRTGKYAINPRIYSAGDRPDVHPHAELGERRAPGPRPRRPPRADRRQEPRGLRVHHRPAGADPRRRHEAPKVISMVGTMLNLVNEVLQSAVGNHFRNTLQDLEAIRLHRDPPGGAAPAFAGDHAST